MYCFHFCLQLSKFSYIIMCRGGLDEVFLSFQVQSVSEWRVFERADGISDGASPIRLGKLLVILTLTLLFQICSILLSNSPANS